MRLHRLAVTAFGPYPGQEVVDFDRLGADGLFLLHGDTGAGKTTLLDAVAFALFGAVPGMREQARRLRCDYADPAVATEVTLELSVRGHRLLLVRGPEYERPKKRGGGTTKQQARASLTWVGDAPRGHAPDGVTRLDEVGRTVERLLGMSKDQFFQVVLLPQGEFARFLCAETGEREKLLEKLFGTQHFALVEQWFRDRRVLRGRELEAGRVAAGQLAARVAQVVGEEPPEHAGDDWLAELVTRTELAASDAVTAELAAAAERDRAEAKFLVTRELADRVTSARSAHAELARLDAQAQDREARRAELSAARRAGGVPPVAREYERVAELVRDAEREVEDRFGALPASAGPTPDAGWARTRAARAREEAGTLAALVAQARAQDSDRDTLAALTIEARRADAAIQECAGRLSSLPAEIADGRERLAQADRAAGLLPGLLSTRDELTELSLAAERIPAAEAAASAAALAHTTAVDDHQDARESFQDIRQRRLAGMAAELAGALADDAPCPVCGSGEHPAPAQGAVGRVTAADEREAAQREQDAQAARERARDRLAQADQTLGALRDRVGGRDVATDLAHAAAAYAEAAALAAGRDRLATRLDAVEREAERLRERRLAAEKQAAGYERERDVLTERIAERSARLDEARGEYADVAARRTSLLDTADRLDALAESLAALDSAETRAAEQRAVLAKAVAEAGFADVDEATAAARPDRVIQRLERELDDARAREAAARRELAALGDVDPTAQVPLGAAADAVTQARETFEQAKVTERVARSARGDVAALAERLRAVSAALAPVEAEYEELSALTDVVNGRGQNARKMSLRAYVLASRLEEVAVAASARLRRMSEDRFSFVHSDAAGPRGKRGGLGLDVLDDYSGRVRPAKTLSGGETFLASLALALGLADVVAAETGGALLDTLFVDEGFGMLDADTLDEVMNTLDELRAGGRVVGLVSHVEELRQRIPTRLRVRKSRTGSSVELIG
ncbi:exonuclease SbcC [Actinophytocola xinjiangensis]|uniref:Nuclease SbcCD subunit C n=1 Tax=Actinophytocola xinjiangensis TaxID=485602 RepID=A0A7Z0WKM1_9PSEU|nr:SMC family ATPase [Actinophytocola xinjiangensis]OLF07215.1 exonuclease SbcC [Actinophytocola xinjiangensis]